VLYADFMTDPADTIARCHTDLGLPFTDETGAAIRRYLENKPKGKHGKFEYNRSQAEQIAAERAQFQAYQDYFAVPNEV